MSLKTWLGIGVIATVVAAIVSDKHPTNQHDAEEEIYKTNPFPEFDNQASYGPLLVDVTCKKCGATMKLNSERNIVHCPYCDSTKIIIENDGVQISKSKLENYRKVEQSKHNAYATIAIEREKTKQRSDFTTLIILLIMLSTCFIPLFLDHLDELLSDPPNHYNEIQIPMSAKDYEGDNVDATIKALKAIGFKNIETEGLNDLTTGWIKKEYSIESIYINGNQSFTADTWFPTSSKITIYYHSFKNENTN